MRCFQVRGRRICSLIGLIALLTAAAWADTPRYKHDHLNIFPVASVAKGGAVTVDGDLSEWSVDAFVTMSADPEMLGRYAVRVAYAYDATGLWVAARVISRTPQTNHTDPAINPFLGWQGDALQFRLISDAAVTQPVPPDLLTSDRIVHCTLWQFSDKALPVLDVRFGMNFHAPTTLTGMQSALAYRQGDGYYTME